MFLDVTRQFNSRQLERRKGKDKGKDKDRSKKTDRTFFDEEEAQAPE